MMASNVEASLEKSGRVPAVEVTKDVANDEVTTAVISDAHNSSKTSCFSGLSNQVHSGLFINHLIVFSLIQKLFKYSNEELSTTSDDFSA